MKSILRFVKSNALNGLRISTDHEHVIPLSSKKGILSPLFPRFVTVGACGTLAQYATLWTGVEFAGISAAMASAIGYLLGSLVNYWLNYYFTFSSERSHMDAMSRFYIVVAIGWCLNTCLMVWLTHQLDWDTWVAQVFATVICLGWNFAAAKYWIFRKTT